MNKIQIPGLEKSTEALRPVFELFGGPSGFAEGYRRELGVDRETAAVTVGKMVECVTRAETAEEAAEYLARAIFEGGQAREPWAVGLIKATLVKELPGWAETYRAAVDKGRDPATVLAVTYDLTMGQAAERVRAVQRHLEGLTPEQVAEAGLQDDSGKTFEEAVAELA